MTIQEMLAKLLLSGMSQRDIAQKVGTTQPTINRAAKGSDIRYVTGKAIECLYLQMTDAADIESAALGSAHNVSPKKHRVDRAMQL